MKKRFNKVYIEITNACNLSCSFCGHTTRAPSFMSLTDFTQVLDRLEGHASMLLFHVMGEPMLHPHLALFLTLAGERGFAVTLTTNGTLLFDRVSQLMGKAALVRLNLSVQSLEQFPEAERVGRLDSLISAVRELVPAQQSLREKFLVSFRFWTRDDDGFSEPLLERL
ncbi:MAG TPA: radical SAM protein, partial [Treponema sp.]|nr:radical SAM protein [Treponema sp.]